MTTNKVVGLLEGTSIRTGIQFDSAKGIIQNPEGIAHLIADEIESLIKKFDESYVHRVDEKFGIIFSQDEEVQNLVNILMSGPKNASSYSALPTRTYNLILHKLGVDFGGNDLQQLEKKVVSICKDPQYRSRTPEIASIICGSVGFAGANWGLQEQLFGEKFDLSRSIAWMKTQAK
ncbi:hypothetical protein [Teichococcus aestuarii]|uniref:hypothetical protein n=1 Tax=Teichococcus aestuarii TaxID=568898 RepID=UPI0011B2870F|nr:hypothetical protein [Pseudoroseomonas aestuarii]